LEQLRSLHAASGDLVTSQITGSHYQQTIVLRSSTYIHTYIHTYMKFITRCIVEDGSNQRRGLLLGGGL